MRNFNSSVGLISVPRWELWGKWKKDNHEGHLGRWIKGCNGVHGGTHS